jgi:hypothetical protein
MRSPANQCTKQCSWDGEQQYATCQRSQRTFSWFCCGLWSQDPSDHETRSCHQRDDDGSPGGEQNMAERGGVRVT